MPPHPSLNFHRLARLQGEEGGGGEIRYCKRSCKQTHTYIEIKVDSGYLSFGSQTESSKLTTVNTPFPGTNLCYVNCQNALAFPTLIRYPEYVGMAGCLTLLNFYHWVYLPLVVPSYYPRQSPERPSLLRINGAIGPAPYCLLHVYSRLIALVRGLLEFPVSDVFSSAVVDVKLPTKQTQSCLFRLTAQRSASSRCQTAVTPPKESPINIAYWT